jgi:hypothetical protein
MAQTPSRHRLTQDAPRVFYPEGITHQSLGLRRPGATLSHRHPHTYPKGVASPSHHATAPYASRGRARLRRASSGQPRLSTSFGTRTPVHPSHAVPQHPNPARQNHSPGRGERRKASLIRAPSCPPVLLKKIPPDAAHGYAKLGAGPPGAAARDHPAEELHK